MLHVGSTDFPVNTEKEFETHYMEYVENLSEISTICPKSVMLVSSVLPRNGSKTNRQIRLFNDKLKALTENESNLIYADHSSYVFECDQIQTSLSKKNDSENIHLNTLGREKLAGLLQMVLKETVYRCKLENEWQIRVK